MCCWPSAVRADDRIRPRARWCWTGPPIRAPAAAGCVLATRASNCHVAARALREMPGQAGGHRGGAKKQVVRRWSK